MTLLHSALIAFGALLSWGAAWHALLSKREPQAAFGWIAVCVIFPFIGPALYFLFGINRIRARASKFHRRMAIPVEREHGAPDLAQQSLSPPPPTPHGAVELVRLADAITGRSLVAGNRIELLCNGEQAYPAMLEAIDQAQEVVFLATYIFDTDDTGSMFVDRLAKAHARSVDVRVLIDGVGELYSWPKVSTLLRRHKIPVARFLPPRLIPPELHMNLRNHAKILITDYQVGFTGGMNIGDRHLASRLQNRSRVVDTHFRLTGPIVHQMAQVFREDWRFVTGEELSLPLMATATDGRARCRVITDGPDEELDKLTTILVNAIATARKRVSIMTPYFLPPWELFSALQAAALRGVRVDIVLPAKNNLRFVHWATQRILWDLLNLGVRVYYQPPPFVHTKLFLVDDSYTHIGSANLDPRSLRLNFELAIEVYDELFARVVRTHFDQVLRQSSQVQPQTLERRRLSVKTRDALAWLFSPYL